MADDSATSLERLDPLAAQELAGFVEAHVDVLTERSLALYARWYPFSRHGGVNPQQSALWARNSYLLLAGQLRRAAVNPDEYGSVGGDMVLQHETQLYAIDAFLEACLFHARVIAQTVWEFHAGDAQTMDRLLVALETFIQAKMRANMASFSAEICRPQALSRTWRLGQEDSDAPGLDEPSPGCPPCAGAARGGDVFELLTPREADMARLAAAGRANVQIAGELGVRLSTVKNTLSRVYAKLGVSGRVELALLASGASEGPAPDLSCGY